MLIAMYMQEGYQVAEITRSVDEIYDTWEDGAPQVFYYDDFLGSTTITEGLSKNEDNRLLKLMERVHRFPNKRLILTTREYLLQQARLVYERIAQYNFDPTNCTISLDDYTDEVRARILYNHLYFSGLSVTERANPGSEKTYEEIVGHRNFNPRLIQQSLAISKSLREDGQRASVRLQRSLDRPDLLWDHIINSQLEPDCAMLLSVLLTLRQPAILSELESAFTACTEILGHKINSRTFIKTLKLLSGTMIKSPRVGSDSWIEFHNPSIRDYMQRHVKRSPSIIEALLRSAEYFEQISAIYRIPQVRFIEPRPDFLTPHLPELVAACMRTMKKSSTLWHRILTGNQEDEELISNAVAALEIAHYYNSAELANWVGASIIELEDIDLSAWELSTIEKVCEYLNVAALFGESRWEVPRVLESSRMLANSMNRWIRKECLESWSGALYAQDLIDEHDLYVLIGLDACEDVETVLQTIAQQWIDSINTPQPATPNEGVYADPDDIYPGDMMKYIEAYEDPASVFTGHEEAKRRAVELGLLDASAGHPSKESSQAERSSASIIHAMMNSIDERPGSGETEV
jgi:hypothetical protein